MDRKPNILFILADDMGYGDWKLVQPRAPQTYRDKIDGPMDLRQCEDAVLK